MFNCGLMAATLTPATIGRIFERFAGRPTRVTVDLDAMLFDFSAETISEQIAFSLAPFDRALIEAGGWVDYADRRY
jgi:3-isopropylmalate/(R)-2-methylmalate dehydratase small subunit